MTPPFDAQTVARITGAPFDSVDRNLPLVREALVKEGIWSPEVEIAALATIGTEVPHFEPINELGSTAYFRKLYETRADLGNHEPGDGAKYHGRGFIQLTGRANYHLYGGLVGADLEADPDRALEPMIAAKVLAVFFRRMKVDQAANGHDWGRVRRLVNGGTNGLDRFMGLVRLFLGEAP